MIQKNNKGFTLIELLIVIAIIGILSSVVLSSLNAARLKARNVARISQLNQIRKSLELYYDDHGAYPYIGPQPGNVQSDCDWGHQADPNNIVPGLVPTYISRTSSDPTHLWVAGTTNQACLIYASDGKDYSVGLYDIHDPSPGHNAWPSYFDYSGYPAYIDPFRDGTADCNVDLNDPNHIYNWKVYTPGACGW